MAVSKTTKTTKTKKDLASSELVHRLKQDKELAKSGEKYSSFLSYAQMYDDDLFNNLELTSFDLDEKYATADKNGWFDFLRYPIVKRYIDGFLEEQAEKEAQRTLARTAGGAKDALAVQKKIEESRKSSSNASYIVMFIPQRDMGKD